MKYFVFAGNRVSAEDSLRNLINEVGGARNLIGAFDEVSDATVFTAILAQISTGLIEFENRIWANALSVQPHSLADAFEWEFRVGTSLDDPALQHCSIKKDVGGLGVCGIVSMDCRVLRNWHKT